MGVRVEKQRESESFPLSRIGLGEVGILVPGDHEDTVVVGGKNEVFFLGSGTYRPRDWIGSYRYRVLEPDERIVIDAS